MLNVVIQLYLKIKYFVNEKQARKELGDYRNHSNVRLFNNNNNIRHIINNKHHMGNKRNNNIHSIHNRNTNNKQKNKRKLCTMQAKKTKSTRPINQVCGYSIIHLFSAN